MTKNERRTPALFFDLDGTLVDSSLDIVTAANLARKELGWKPIAHDTVIEAVGDGVRAFIEKIFCKEDSPDFKVALATFLRVYQDYATIHTKPYGGISEILETLHSKKTPMAVISNKPSKMVDQVIEHFGWRKYFKIAYGGDSLEKAKPDAFPLKTAYEKLSLTPNHLPIMVGDGAQDVQAAMNYGISSIWVSWGFNKDLSSKATFRADHPREILELCEKACYL